MSSVQHPPALRVGGRRLSTTARPKPHHTPASPSSPTSERPAGGVDYPRPNAQGQGEETDTHPPPHNEEETPKKEKKHGHGGYDSNKLRESVHHKLDATTPSKDHSSAKHSFGAAGRIGQPMGRVLAV